MREKTGTKESRSGTLRQQRGRTQGRAEEGRDAVRNGAGVWGWTEDQASRGREPWSGSVRGWLPPRPPGIREVPEVR